MQDHIEHFVLVSRRIRRISRRHLAEQTANRPPIDRLSVGRRCAENLRRHIVIGSADAVVTHGVVVDRDVGRVWVGSFLLAIVAAVLGLFIALEVSVIRTINRIKNTALNGVPDNRISGFLTGMLMVFGFQLCQKIREFSARKL